MKRHLLIGAILAGLAGCSSNPGTAATPPISATTTAAMSSAVTTTAAASATTDEAVCVSLEKTGKPFYPTYAAIMKKEEPTLDPITLATQLGVLSTTGTQEGQIDGSATINQASPDLRLKLSTMTRDAIQTAQRFADTAVGAVPRSDITAIVNSFTSALVACTKAGYQPSWFDPAALVG